MSGFVEKALVLIGESLQNHKKDVVKDVRELEEKINQLHLQVDSQCMKLIATQSPVAKDLRFTLAVIKMNADIERMGDQCLSISYATEEYYREEPLAEMKLVQEMLKDVQKMLRMSLDCFIQGNLTMAEEVLEFDDQVDQSRNLIKDQMIKRMQKEPSLIPAAMDLIFMARNFERIADHCTNIAEDVIFVHTGKDIRHGGMHE